MAREDTGYGYARDGMQGDFAYGASAGVADTGMFEGWLDETEGQGNGEPQGAPMAMPPAGTADRVEDTAWGEIPPMPPAEPAPRGRHRGGGRKAGRSEKPGRPARPEHPGHPGDGHLPPHGDMPPKPKFGAPGWAVFLVALLAFLLGAGATLVADRMLLYRYGPNPWPVPEAPVQEATLTTGDIESAVHAAVREEFEADRKAREEAAAAEAEAEAPAEAPADEAQPASDDSPDAGNLDGVEIAVPEGFSPVDGSDHEFHSDDSKVTMTVTKAEVGEGGRSARAWYDEQGDSPYIRKEERDVEGTVWLMAVQNLGGDEEERLFGPVTYEADTEDGAFKIIVRCTPDGDDTGIEAYKPFSDVATGFLSKVRF